MSEAPGPDRARRLHADNAVAWDQAATAYTADNELALADLRAGDIGVRPGRWGFTGPERKLLGDLGDCGRAIHLQCASGFDTLGLWKLGAGGVVGLDISALHLANARWLAEQLEAPAEFVQCDLLDAPADLDGTADLVYTGKGALYWLHDLPAWAAVVARLLAPGGRFVCCEVHPAAFLFDDEADELRGSGESYFSAAVDSSRGWTEEYVGSLGLAPSVHALKHERSYTVADVFSALTGAGLQVTDLGEHVEDILDSFPRLPATQSELIPHTFTLAAARP